MFKNKKALAIVLGFVALAALLIGCAAGEEKATPTAAAKTPGVGTPTAAAEAEPKRGGRLNIYLSDPGVIDPQRGVGNTHYSIVGLRLIGPRYGPELNRYDATSDPELAESWEMSTDGLTYTFHLRQGVKWQDKPPVNGREVVAADVKYSFDRVRTDTVAKAMYGFLLGSMTSVEAPDKYTVKFTFAKPWYDFMAAVAYFAFVILPPEVGESEGGFDKVEHTIGAGPFMLESYWPSSKVVFKRNPTYFRSPLPYLDEIVGYVVADSSSRQAAIRAGNLDLLSGVDVTSVESFNKTNPELKVLESEPAAGWAIAMRTDKTPFNDVRVRQAVALSLNRQQWVDAIFKGHGVIDNGVLNAAMKQWKLPTDQLGEGAKYYRYDPQEAKRLLAEAGYPDGFETEFTVSVGVGRETSDAFDLVVDYLSRIGIKARVKPLESGAYAANISSQGKYEGMAYSGEWTTTCAGLKPVGWYGPTQLTNISHVNDPKMNEFIERVGNCTTFECRKQVLDEFQRYDSVMLYRIPAPYQNSITVYQPWVKDYSPRVYGYAGRIYEYIWLDKK